MRLNGPSLSGTVRRRIRRIIEAIEDGLPSATDKDIIELMQKLGIEELPTEEKTEAQCIEERAHALATAFPHSNPLTMVKTIVDMLKSERNSPIFKRYAPLIARRYAELYLKIKA